jgi:hypothetical protein
VTNEYRTITTANGQYISLDGSTLPTPIFFEPDEYRVNTSASTAGVLPVRGSTIALAWTR